MPTKKQLAALAYGRAVRKANLRKGVKRCRTNKKKTKASFDDVLAELDSFDTTNTATVNIDGKEITIPIGKKKKSSGWAKAGKILVGSALTAALGALGYYGLKKGNIVDFTNLENKLKKWGATAKEWLKVKTAAKEDNPYAFLLSKYDKGLKEGKIKEDDAKRRKERINTYAPKIGKDVNLYEYDRANLFNLILNLKTFIEDYLDYGKINPTNALGSNKDIRSDTQKLISRFSNFTKENLFDGYTDKKATVAGLRNELNNYYNKYSKITKDAGLKVPMEYLNKIKEYGLEAIDTINKIFTNYEL